MSQKTFSDEMHLLQVTMPEVNTEKVIVDVEYEEGIEY